VCSNPNALIEDVKAHPSRYINISVFGSDPLKKVEKAKAKAEKKAIKRADEIAEMEYEQKVKQIKAGQ
jgi:hypothetical protein